MTPLSVVLILVLVALLGAQLTFSQRHVPLGPQIFIAIGGPFLLLGFALGPHMLEILSRTVVTQLVPLFALGLGWIGVLFGLQLDLDHLRRFPSRYLAIAWLQAALTFGIVFVLGYTILDAWAALSLEAIALAAAATASVSTPAAIALISNMYMTRGKIGRLLFYVASLDAAVGIVVLGVTHAAQGTQMLTRGIAFTFAERFAISILLGLLFGLLFLSLTRIRPRSQEFMLLLMGLVVFAAGTAFYLNLSPLFVCMVAGIVIGNLSPLRRRIYAALSEWEQPIYIMVLILAGALLQFPSWWVVPLAAAYVATRFLAKWIAGLVASRLNPGDLTVPGHFGLALIPQGGLSLAMAISFVLIYVPSGPGLESAVDVFFATVVIAVGVSDLMGPFLVRAVLERAGELDRHAVYAGGVSSGQRREGIAWRSR